MTPLKFPLGRRRQLFEIQDFAWCPQAIRDGVTDLLVLNLKILPLYEPAIPYLSQLAKLSGGRWIDLCAGAGGGSILLKQKMPGEITELVLTDLYPHTGLVLPENVRLITESVDARKVPKALQGMRTLFTSFHHLPDDVAMEVLKNARDDRAPIAVFEFTDRSLFCLFMMMPSFFTSFFLTPFVFPWKLSRFFWTYIIPAIPLVTLIDILLSCFRTRTTGELKTMTEKLQSPDYVWETGEVPTYLGLKLTFLIGKPS